MTVKERRSQILKLLEEKETLSVKDLAKEFKVSVPTLYKDLDTLEQEKLILKSYGGIQLLKDDKYRHDFFYQLKVEKESKKAIASRAAKLINDGETIFLDASTTTFYLCKELKKTNLRNVTIVTNSVFVPTELIIHDQFRIICLGGVLDRASAEFIGPRPELYLQNIHASSFFFSVRSLSPEKGVLDYYNPNDIRIKTMLFENADRGVCMVDSTKFFKTGTVNWVGYDKLKTIITDRNVPPEVITRLEDNGVEVLV